jgi:hypothetical protein
MKEICREAIAKVDCGGGDAVPPEKQSLSDAGLRVKVRSKLDREALWDAERVFSAGSGTA